MRRLTPSGTFLLVIAFAFSCGSDRETPQDGEQWFSCDVTSDCNEGLVCSSGRCTPADEPASNNRANNVTTNNVSTNNQTVPNTRTNNATNNRSNNDSTNNTTGSNNALVCPQTGPPVPVAVDAVHDVTFELTNNYATDIWYGELGWFCEPWTIDGAPRALGFRCGCECPNPGPPGVVTYRRIAVNETATIDWDGRSLVVYDECVDCSEWGRGPIYEQTGVLQPLTAGRYTFRLPIVLDQPPGDCVDNGDGTASCDPMSGDPNGMLPGEIATLCQVGGTSLETTLEFDLPTDGVLNVPVSLP